MNVYKVVTEQDGNPDVITTVRFVTCDSESLADVSKYFEKECKDLDDTLISVSYILTVCQHLKEIKGGE